MTADDQVVEKYLNRLLDEAPALNADQAAVVARAFAQQNTDATASDAA